MTTDSAATNGLLLSPPRLSNSSSTGVTMSSSGYAFTDFDLFGTVSHVDQSSRSHHHHHHHRGQPQQQQQQRQQQQQQQYHGPCTNGYNPSASPPPLPYPGTLRYNHGLAHPQQESFFPSTAFMPATGFEHVPLTHNSNNNHHVVQQQQQQQERQQQNVQGSKDFMRISSSASSSSSLAPSPMMAYSLFSAFTPPPPGIGSTTSMPAQADPAMPQTDDSWLDSLQMNIAGISLEPLPGGQVLKRVRSKTDDVVTRYLPCVEFLVQCQQELRVGLANATKQRLVRHAYSDNMTPRQFYNRYLARLDQRFHQTYQHLMEEDVLTLATQEIQTLCREALAVQNQGCEAMKNTFLGGMRDGQSWGLRKWLSQHGGALHICNDLECILTACQKLDRNAETTLKLSERLRPLAKQALQRLQSDVPASYQENSTAHPYLPFFHRLESALKGMSNFDPEDDDVICIDDEDEGVEAKKMTTNKPSAKRPAPVNVAKVVANAEPVAKRPKTSERTETDFLNDFGRFGTPPIDNPLDSDRDDNDSVIEIFAPAQSSSDVSDNGDAANDLLDRWIFDLLPNQSPTTTSEAQVPLPPLMGTMDNPLPPPDSMSAEEMTQRLEHLAYLFDINKQSLARPIAFQRESFWDTFETYAKVLRLLVDLIQNPDSHSFLNPMNPQTMTISGYSDIIKHPLCFRDIVHSLVNLDPSQTMSDGTDQPSGTGQLLLGTRGLERWNMWRGMDLLQAVDLVFLNALAFHGKQKCEERNVINRLRKILWDELHRITKSYFGENSDRRRQVTPTRRGETSGFVVRKP